MKCKICGYKYIYEKIGTAQDIVYIRGVRGNHYPAPSKGICTIVMDDGTTLQIRKKEKLSSLVSYVEQVRDGKHAVIKVIIKDPSTRGSTTLSLRCGSEELDRVRREVRRIVKEKKGIDGIREGLMKIEGVSPHELELGLYEIGDEKWIED